MSQTLPYEVFLPVSSFSSFAECERATGSALVVARAEVEELLGHVWGLTFGEPRFLEFDSPNPSHACGYFEVDVSGPDDLILVIEAALERR